MSTSTETRREFYVEQARRDITDLHRDGYVTLEQVADWAPSGDIHEAAREFADGHEVLIYHHHQDALFASGVLSDYEADANDMVSDGLNRDEDAGDFVRRYITLLVFLFLEDCYMEGYDRALDYLADVDGE